jgi:hypothetical protein
MNCPLYYYCLKIEILGQENVKKVLFSKKGETFKRAR